MSICDELMELGADAWTHDVFMGMCPLEIAMEGGMYGEAAHCNGATYVHWSDAEGNWGVGCYYY